LIRHVPIPIRFASFRRCPNHTGHNPDLLGWIAFGPGFRFGTGGNVDRFSPVLEGLQYPFNMILFVLEAILLDVFAGRTHGHTVAASVAHPKHQRLPHEGRIPVIKMGLEAKLFNRW
jgi:hypothetical protein